MEETNTLAEGNSPVQARYSMVHRPSPLSFPSSVAGRLWWPSHCMCCFPSAAGQGVADKHAFCGAVSTFLFILKTDTGVIIEVFHCTVP